MRLELEGTRADYFITGFGMFVVGEGENGGERIRRMVDDELAAQLTIQSTQTGSHQGRKITFDNPLLQLDRARCGLDDVQQTGPGKVAHFAFMVDVVHEQVEEREVLLLCPPREPLMFAQGLSLLSILRLGLEPGG